MSIRVQEEDFSIEDEIDEIKSVSDSIGGVVTFLGTTRNISKGRDVEKLIFEHYQGMAEKKLNELRDIALKKFDIVDVTIIHRVGEIGIGGNIVLIVVGAEHRADAFRACEWCIDELKQIVPIWKKEITPEGDVWVEDHP